MLQRLRILFLVSQLIVALTNYPYSLFKFDGGLCHIISDPFQVFDHINSRKY